MAKKENAAKGKTDSGKTDSGGGVHFHGFTVKDPDGVLTGGGKTDNGDTVTGNGKTKRRFINTYTGGLGCFYAGRVYELNKKELAAFKNDTEEA
jgi:hypothetical protein